MDIKRRSYYNKLNEDVKAARRMIEMHLRSIESIKSASCAGKDLDFFRNRITTTQSGIEAYKATIETLQTKMQGVRVGEYDDYINKAFEDTKNLLDEKKESALKKERESDAYSEIGRMTGKEYDQKERGEERKYKGLNGHREKLKDIEATLPEHISKNLPTMPNNKGYRWRGVTFYGMMAPEPGATTVTFDKKFNGTFITETSPESEVTWFKGKDNQPKKLVSSFRRRRNFKAPATLY